MSRMCSRCGGPIDPPDSHKLCIVCLGLLHAETALVGSECPHCDELTMRVLRTRLNIALESSSLQPPTAAKVPLVGAQPPTESERVPERRASPPRRSPVQFVAESLRPEPGAAESVSFGVPAEEDEMSLTASDGDWDQSPPAASEADAHPPSFHEELVRILSKAVQDLEIEWSSPQEPQRSKLDSWYFDSGRRAAAPRKSAPFLPDLHDEVTKAWATPQGVRACAGGSELFSKVDGAEARGYLHIPPVEEAVAAHLCPSSSSLGGEASLPSKACRMTAHLADKAYAASGEALSSLHTMAVLQIFQARALKALDEGSTDLSTFRDLRAATDFALKATKKSAQAIGRSMGFMVVMQRQLWLNLTDLKEADRKTLLNAPVSPSGLFGDAVGTITERFSEAVKSSKAMSHFLPRRPMSHAPAGPPPPRHRSEAPGTNPPGSVARNRVQGDRSPEQSRVPDVSGVRERTPSGEPAAKRTKVSSSVPLAVAGDAETVSLNVFVLNAIKNVTFSQKERFPLYLVSGRSPQGSSHPHIDTHSAPSLLSNPPATRGSQRKRGREGLMNGLSEPHKSPLSIAASAAPRPSSLVPVTHTLHRAERSSLVPLGHSPPSSDPASNAQPPRTELPVTHETLGGNERSGHPVIQPLSLRLDAWRAIPNISEWMLNIIQKGYSLQFRRRPPRFNGVIASTVRAQDESILYQEICNLLAKQAIESVPMQERESGFYSRYFVVPKKDGGLRPILDLRQINKALHKRAFKMTTLKQILAHIRPGDWFISVDLKDAYFHIQIAPHHRRFLRFAFKDAAYQFTVLPFGLALAPRTFTKCIDAALSPLRASGIRILNYLDDWLILAQSREVLISHRDAVLSHLDSLGLRVNLQKSALSPTQEIAFLGVRLDSVSMKAFLSEERKRDLTSALNVFSHGGTVPLKRFQRLLGLMAAASPVCPLGLLYMRPLQLWLRSRVPNRAWISGRARITVTNGCMRALRPWFDPNLFSGGAQLGLVTRRKVVTTDASLTGWGALCDGVPASGSWPESERLWHINRLELKAVFLALQSFATLIGGHHVLVRTDNTTVVSYINRQGGVRSRPLFRQAEAILLWADRHLLSIKATHVPGSMNCGADMLSRNGIPQGEWRLNPLSIELIWSQFGKAEVDLFASEENTHCPLFFSLTSSPLGGEALSLPWPRASKYAFPPIKLLPSVLHKIREEKATVTLIAPYWPNQPWFPELLELSTAPPWPIPLRRDLLSQANGSIWHPSPEKWKLHAWKVCGNR
ncbi:uncharacterized protein [Paramisgurnus dabryanus]|uniref:uncharacterized protein n=1 Tax=Paramisgurnus dabryanus TaxID=90735 RepID=UPI003CCF4D4B